MELELHFAPDDLDEAVASFRSALAEVPGARLRYVPDLRAADRHPQFESGMVSGFAVAWAGAATVIGPALVLWLGKGKRVLVKRGDEEIEMEGLRIEEVERVLRALEVDENGD